MFSMLAIITAIICVLLVEGILFLGKRYNISPYIRNRKSLGDDIFSVVVFSMIVIACLTGIIYIYYEIPYDNIVLKDSGIMFAILLVLSGILVRIIYKVVQKLVGVNILVDFLDNEIKWITVFSCIMLMIIFKATHYKTYAYTCGAVIIGKFMWIDASGKQLIKDIFTITEVPTIVIISIIYLLISILGEWWFPEYSWAIYIGFGISIGLIWVINILKKRFNRKI